MSLMPYNFIGTEVDYARETKVLRKLETKRSMCSLDKLTLCAKILSSNFLEMDIYLAALVVCHISYAISLKG